MTDGPQRCLHAQICLNLLQMLNHPPEEEFFSSIEMPIQCLNYIIHHQKIHCLSMGGRGHSSHYVLNL